MGTNSAYSQHALQARASPGISVGTWVRGLLYLSRQACPKALPSLTRCVPGQHPPVDEGTGFPVSPRTPPLSSCPRSAAGLTGCLAAALRKISLEGKAQRLTVQKCDLTQG